MYLTMNRFKVKLAEEATFEEIWLSRDSVLKEVPGFVSFHLLKGQEVDGSHRLYASHTVWESEQAFRDWTTSEQFRRAHAGARPSRDIYLGPPELEIFESLQALTA
ncbi:antibiotic biosynthesis monooxygenase family protein [Pseudoroseicyclus aestuarii]|uniref:Heme-degrading monooxygenase HmoA n=1 Tax=Pseudoroseicyclus aestuarii TaxID=1795041 RepID=A0A318SWF6_9RHOB|nr:antibiotic biosynthesis monooxygenase [Pseudoroseicyclus aestuarii]PYE85853.1 heme-degrading monooxygenase HmoA [Pseudoroseicyclus aestuarii]